MKQTSKSNPKQTTPVQSPYPALQALLPRLATIGASSESRPIFDNPSEVEEFLAGRGEEDKYVVVPVWAINHTDLTSSEVVNWSFRRWLN